MNVTIYLIVLPTGLVSDDGVESVVVIDVKLTRIAADGVKDKHPGSEVMKLSANKVI